MNLSHVESISQAFAHWRSAMASANAATEDAEIHAHLAEAAEVERLTQIMPARTASDVWALVAMSFDQANKCDFIGQDTLVRRAHAEVAALA
ncbi:hypothetical protein [Fuscibacter oryzae]|uniref:Uncharacterized protein n=1 Tax=Fuscibacter oryzae TaxID=2803939 RepID=A0A8J7STT6_9RHOB|nr:hypothetical protein [Fuscibacter oryzae]MBL4928910.1 hypothetical protein [Fuscibacter oryzae]